MKKVNSWYDFEHDIINNMNNLEQFEFDEGIGQIIKKIVNVYGEKLPELYDKYGEDIFKVAYTSDEKLVESDGDLERKLITDFHNNVRKLQKEKKYIACKFETFKKAVENGTGIFERETENLFSKNYPIDILKLMYHNGNIEIHPNSKDFTRIIQTIDFEDCKSFVTGSATNSSIIKNWFKDNPELEVEKILPFIRMESQFFDELCDKYQLDCENIDEPNEKQEKLVELLQEYAPNGQQPKQGSIEYNLEKYLFLSPDLLIELCEPNSRSQKLIKLYGERLPEFAKRYGFDVIRKIYLKDGIEIEEFSNDLDLKFVEDFNKAKQMGNMALLKFEQFKTLYENFPEEAVDLNTKNLLEKYPSELSELCYDPSSAGFHIGYNVKEPARIFQNMEYEDYKDFLQKDRWHFLAISDLLEKNPKLDVDKVMPILNNISMFYMDLYKKIVDDNPQLTDENNRKKKIVEGFSKWKKEHGMGLPAIRDLRDIENYKYLSPEVRKECYNFSNKRIEKIATYYESQIVGLLDKYGVEIFEQAYGFGRYQNEGELNLDSDNNEIDLERKLLEDYKEIIEHRKSVARATLDFDSYAKIVQNAPEEYVGKNNKYLFSKYPKELLKKMYSQNQKKFYLSKENKNIGEIFRNMSYRDIMAYIPKGSYWGKEDINNILIDVLDSDSYQKVQEFRKKSSALNGIDAFVVLYAPENIDIMLENIEKVGNVNGLKLAISSNVENVYEFAEKLYKRYSNYLANVDVDKVIKSDRDIALETLQARIEKSIAENIKNRKIMEYGENLPQSFKDKNPELFLSQEIPEEVKQKYYKRQLQYSDFYKEGKFNNELWENLKREQLYLGTKEEINFLAPAYENEIDIELLNKKVLEVLRRVEDLENNQMASETKKIFIEWTRKNIENPEINYEDFCKKTKNIYALTSHIILSNSSELRRFQDKILAELLDVENPQKTLKGIEKNFLSKEKSIDERLFSCLLYLYPDFSQLCKKATSPVIQKYIKDGKEESVKDILRKDLLKSILGSNNRSIRKFFKKEQISESLKLTLQRLGINSAEEAIEYMDKRVANADYRNRARAEKGKLPIEEGDFIKGLTYEGILYMEQILQNGSLCKEFLGSAAGSDGTPLDTDVSIIGEKGIKETYSYKGNWGPIYVLLKNDDRFANYKEYKTRVQDIPEEEIQKNNEKMEMCYNSNDVGGVRAGFSSTDIDTFIVQDGTYDRRLELEIVKNGFYIPISDIDGKVLFTPKQYDELRTKMSGLEYYGTENEYEIDSILISDEIIKLEEQLDKVHDNNENMRNKIYDKFKKAIEKYNQTLSNPEDGISLKEFIDDKITENEIEILCTGSSERDTNVPGGKLDFDFIIRLDNKLSKSLKGRETKEKIIRGMCEEFHINYQPGDIKDVEIDFDGEKVKADFSFIGKTDKIEYSTEKCLKERLEKIKEKEPEKYRYIIANIMLAKKVLAENDAYKKKDGGLGGVGIENWILQNGGSFHKAARDFLEVAKKCNGNYEEFKKQYAIWDFGKNHYAYKDERNYFPHDDFIYVNLKASKFTQMVSTLEEYIKSHSFSEFNNDFGKKVLSFSDIKTLAKEIPVSEEIGSARPIDKIKELENEQEHNNIPIDVDTIKGG